MNETSGPNGPSPVLLVFRVHPRIVRYVSQGQKDMEKPFIVHNIFILQQRSVKVIVYTCAIRNFLIFPMMSHKVTFRAMKNSSERFIPKPRNKI